MRHVLLWGAINARTPDPNVPQVAFKADYAGGWGKYRDGSYWKTFKNACKPYDGPGLAFGVTACTAPDGSYWAVQAWQRFLPLRGFAPFRPQQGAVGFNVSHWSGPLAQSTVSQNFTYDGDVDRPLRPADLRRRAGLRLQDARLQQEGPTATRATSTSTPTTRSTGRLEARRGQGAAPAQRGLLLQLRAADAAARLPRSTETRGPAPGELERVTVMGPGVTPDVQWVGPGLGKYDAAAGRGVQRALRPARRPGRQGLQERALIPSVARYMLARHESRDAQGPSRRAGAGHAPRRAGPRLRGDRGAEAPQRGRLRPRRGDGLSRAAPARGRRAAVERVVDRWPGGGGASTG